MIRFINPVALWGLIAVGAPVIIHLLRRQRARRMSFPSLQFIQPQRTSAVRLRTPEDPWLMLVRTAIVAAAVVALAQPVVITSARREAWDARMSRAIVIDERAPASRFAQQIAEVSRVEQQGAYRAIEIRSVSPGLAIGEAVEAIRHSPPSRREIVVVSPLQYGALTSEEVAGVPADVGLRFVPVGERQGSSSFTAPPLLGADGNLAEQQVIVDGFRTAVVTSRGSGTPAGLRVIGADATSVARLLRIVGSAGTPAPDVAQPLVFAFARAAMPAHAARLPQPWMLPVVTQMQQDAALFDASRAVEATQPLPAGDVLIVARDKSGRPLVTAAASGQELLIAVAAPIDSLLSVVAVRSALVARGDAYAWHQHETERIPPFVLSAWARPAAPADRDAWRSAAPGDARWMWAAALAFLVLETVMRRQRTSATVEQVVHAA